MRKQETVAKKCLKILENEMIRYCISGGLVTLTNAMGYFILIQFGIVYTLSNMISLILSKLVGYILNKFFVFGSKSKNIKQTLEELARFVLARGFTGIVDFLGVIVLVEYMDVGEYIAKVILMVIVIIMNYIIGKKLVFIEC